MGNEVWELLRENEVMLISKESKGGEQKYEKLSRKGKLGQI